MQIGIGHASDKVKHGVQPPEEGLFTMSGNKCLAKGIFAQEAFTVSGALGTDITRNGEKGVQDVVEVRLGIELFTHLGGVIKDDFVIAL